MNNLYTDIYKHSEREHKYKITKPWYMNNYYDMVVDGHRHYYKVICLRVELTNGGIEDVVIKKEENIFNGFYGFEYSFDYDVETNVKNKNMKCRTFPYIYVDADNVIYSNGDFITPQMRKKYSPFLKKFRAGEVETITRICFILHKDGKLPYDYTPIHLPI